MAVSIPTIGKKKSVSSPVLAPPVRLTVEVSAGVPCAVVPAVLAAIEAAELESLPELL